MSQQTDTQQALASIMDRGCQYASTLYRDALAQFGLIGSISAPENPYNNTQAESFMKTLKVVYLAGFKTFRDVANGSPYFIEQIWMYSALGSQSSNKFEAQLARQAACISRPDWSSPNVSVQRRVIGQRELTGVSRDGAA
ncbi:hypothetical protein ACO0LO_23310 [Undibacterium sp. TJN25]|uniref:hypothetical protein n=1 Tax=Undibacterium sp. TJN25 TaxID=3413056 RepID=UPI003BF33606